MSSTKGVSTLIASVLLIAFTVSVAMIVMGWFSTFASSTTQNVSGVTQSAIGCSAGIIEIDHVYLKNSTVAPFTGNATISVINSGQIALTVNAMIIFTNGTACRTATGGVVQAGSSGILNITTNDCPQNMVNFSSVLLTTSCAGITARTTQVSDVSFI
jgi:flagellin-like protein